MASRERILVTVKTYPTLSKKYGETVCTAGLREDGTWVRLYPVPFRRLGEEQQYRKYDWIECEIEKRTNDARPESFLPRNANEMLPVDRIEAGKTGWPKRRKLVIETAAVFDRLDELIAGAKANQLSLAVFKPSEILGFTWEVEEREWDPDKVAQMRAQSNQSELFDEDKWRETFRLVDKLPYSFSYTFKDSTGKKSKLQVLDWEAGALYWNCLRGCGGDEECALRKVKDKYLHQFVKTDLHFFLGTTQRFHKFGVNPWVIVGTFPAPHQNQMELGF